MGGDDEDLFVVNNETNLICPLTNAQFKKPVKSTVSENCLVAGYFTGSVVQEYCQHTPPSPWSAFLAQARAERNLRVGTVIQHAVAVDIL